MMRLFLERLNALLQWQNWNKLNAIGRRHTPLKHSGLTILQNATQKSGANGWRPFLFGVIFFPLLALLFSTLPFLPASLVLVR